GKQCGLAATGVYQPSLRSPWLAAYVNTLMIQQVLNEPSWRSRMKLEDFKALTPLIYAHVNPYG
ncbi:Tn3 family transposase, partial [Thiolapillus sp.]|uniref:Tn3 family transposase n=1 Tax=Thiolapillus sp. TaxID=2017437 RepID=UPI003AF8069B